MSIIGAEFGIRLGGYIGKFAEIIGGVLLIVIAASLYLKVWVW